MAIFGILMVVLGSLVPLAVFAAIVYFIVKVARKNDTTKDSTTEVKTSFLDICIYFFMFISLISSVGAIISVLFSAIDHRFKDVLNYSNYNALQSGSDVRMAISLLFVLFPIYLGLAWYNSSRIKKDIAKAELPIRKFYIYSLVLVTSLSMAGSLISVVYNYLSGEIFARFLPKSLTVFFIALIILGYHIYSLKRDFAKRNIIPLISTIFISLLVLISVVYSIKETGSPSEIRKMKFDDRRLQDLSRIQSDILQKWQTTAKIPESLLELNNSFSGDTLPKDPETNESYEYKVLAQSKVDEQAIYNFDANGNKFMNKKKTVLSNAEFEICASFATSKKTATQNEIGAYDKMMYSPYSMSNYSSYDSYNPSWNHGAGKTCFKRVIDINQYQIYNNNI